MDFKKMDSKELLHLISNKCDKEEINDGDKLVIQNITKELFNKKCEKYKKVYFIRTKIKQYDVCEDCGEAEDPELMSSNKVRIIKYDDKNSHLSNFPFILTKRRYDEWAEDGISMIECLERDGEKKIRHHFLIYKIEDIEL